MAEGHTLARHEVIFPTYMPSEKCLILRFFWRAGARFFGKKGMGMELVETGKIVNTHGLRGEVKIEPWADSAEAFCAFERLYIDGAEHRLERSRTQKGFVIAKLAGIDSIDEAERVKNRIVYVPREDIPLEEGGFLVSDLVGCEARDQHGNVLGLVTDVISLPRGEVLEIRGEREILVPLVKEFLIDAAPELGVITVCVLEGM